VLRSAARLFHLERINAKRWRDANEALEATGHSGHWLAGVGLSSVTRTSAWVLALLELQIQDGYTATHC